jgi:cell wall-associated NlpC family hydrolase
VTDPRITPANDRVAHVSVADRFPDREPVEGSRRAVAVPLVDLRRSPEGARDRQAAMGEGFLALEDRDGWTFGTLMRDGYAGWVQTVKLGPPVEATHVVAVRGTHLYPAPDIKREPVAALTFGARFRIVAEDDRFTKTSAGAFLPRAHLRAIGQPLPDPVAVARLFEGTPYLWGGNSVSGIDCSGLVQAALLATGLPCPGDSDLQEAALGHLLDAGAPALRGDLYFWKGHVAMALDGDTLIHANAHHMAVAQEPIAEAIARIAAQGGGPVTARRRLHSLGRSS